MAGYWNDRPTAISENKAIQYSKDVKLIPYLVAEYGGVKFAHEIVNFSVEFLKRFRRDDKRYQATLTMLKYGIPVGIMGADLIAKYRGYRKIKKGDDTTYSEKELKLSSLLNIPKNKAEPLHECKFDLGKEVTYWIFERPKTEKFKIKGFHQYENLSPIADIWKIESGTIFVPIEYDGKDLIWEFSFARYQGEMVIHASDIVTKQKDAINLRELRNVVFKEFLASFDIRKNVVIYSDGLESRPRHIGRKEVNQFDVVKFGNEVKKVLQRKKKRGYVFVGIPGVGKSSIIRELETEIIDYPFIYAPADVFSTQNGISLFFETIKNIQPCVIVLEDLDSFGFQTKTSKLGAFLDEIDDVNRKLNAVFIATVNDTDLVHYSLINRPGRFDQVIMLKPPKTVDELYHVMNTAYGKQGKEYTKHGFIPFDEIDQTLLKRMLSKAFTQADACEVIERSLLIADHVTNEVIAEAITDLESSKAAIKACNFKNKNPYDIAEDDECEAKCIEPAGYGIPTKTVFSS